VPRGDGGQLTEPHLMGGRSKTEGIHSKNKGIEGGEGRRETCLAGSKREGWGKVRGGEKKRPESPNKRLPRLDPPK